MIEPAPGSLPHIPSVQNASAFSTHAQEIGEIGEIGEIEHLPTFSFPLLRLWEDSLWPQREQSILPTASSAASSVGRPTHHQGQEKEVKIRLHTPKATQLKYIEWKPKSEGREEIKPKGRGT